MVGGINAPKKISCIGTDGKVKPQLLKVLFSKIKKFNQYAFEKISIHRNYNISITF